MSQICSCILILKRCSFRSKNYDIYHVLLRLVFYYSDNKNDAVMLFFASTADYHDDSFS